MPLHSAWTLFHKTEGRTDKITREQPTVCTHALQHCFEDSIQMLEKLFVGPNWLNLTACNMSRLLDVQMLKENQKKILKRRLKLTFEAHKNLISAVRNVELPTMGHVELLARTCNLKPAHRWESPHNEAYSREYKWHEYSPCNSFHRYIVSLFQTVFFHYYMKSRNKKEELARAKKLKASRCVLRLV